MSKLTAVILLPAAALVGAAVAYLLLSHKPFTSLGDSDVVIVGASIDPTIKKSGVAWTSINCPNGSNWVTCFVTNNPVDTTKLTVGAQNDNAAGPYVTPTASWTIATHPAMDDDTSQPAGDPNRAVSACSSADKMTCGGAPSTAGYVIVGVGNTSGESLAQSSGTVLNYRHASGCSGRGMHCMDMTTVEVATSGVQLTWYCRNYHQCQVNIGPPH